MRDTNLVRELLTTYLTEAVSETMDAFFDDVWGTRDAQAEAKFIQDMMIEAVKDRWEEIRDLLIAAPYPSPWLAANLAAAQFTTHPPGGDTPP